MSRMRVNKDCAVITCSPVNFSPQLGVCTCLECKGKWLHVHVHVCFSGEGGTGGKYVHVCVAPPMVVRV